MLKLIFKVKLFSSYHLGAGYGKGFGIDSALLTETGKKGVPVLRGSTLAGLLRDATRRLLKLPPLAKSSASKEVLERIFGSPQQTKRWSISSGYPETKWVEEKKVVQRVRIDPKTRRAEDRSLFTQEVGGAEQVFTFAVTCHQNDASALDEAAFIVAAARFVRQFGGSRRRGLGECTIHLIDASGINVAEQLEGKEGKDYEDYLLERFNSAWLKNNLQKSTQPRIKTDLGIIAPLPNGTKVRVRLVVRLDEPLLISQRSSAGNWFSTRPLIPGTTLRGALAALVAARCDLADEKTYRDFKTLFLRGGIIFPILYPAHLLQTEIYPAVPPSLGLMTCSAEPFKDAKGHGAYKAWEYQKCEECKKYKDEKVETKLEPMENFFILKKVDAYSSTHLPGQSAEMHVRIDAESQRAAKGDLYGYKVLNAGQYFCGELCCADETAWQGLQEMAGISEQKEQPLRLGKARQRGYGKITAWFERLEKEPRIFIQVPLRKRVKNIKESITLTLLTDTIIVNPWGQQANGFTRDWLEQTLGLGALKIEYAHARTRTVDGFNAVLGLPRWRDTALVAGSMALLYLKKLPPGLDWQKRMKLLEEKGIGLRRNEGFGQIAFNHPMYEMCKDITGSSFNIGEWIPQRSFGSPGKPAAYELWEENLPEQLSIFEATRGVGKEKFNNYFASLARWLYISSDTGLDTLISQFTIKKDQTKQGQFILGQPQQALIDAIGAEEYGKRSKDNFYLKETSQKGIAQILEALKSLTELDSSLHKRGIEQIADWIAGQTREREGSR